MPERHRSPEVLRPEVEFGPELAPDSELCLRRLIIQVVEKGVDTRIDSHLIEQVNAAYVEDTDEGHLLKCQTPGCEAECIVRKDDKNRALIMVSESGVALCE